MVMNANAMAWVVGTDTGISSKTIWAVMQGVVSAETVSDGWNYDIPHDPADFGRCYRLLEKVPEWRGRMPEMGAVFPKWKPMAEAWGELEALYREELPLDRMPKLYARIQELKEEGMRLDGWVETSLVSWSRKRA